MSKKSKIRQNTGEKSDRGKGPGEEQRGRIVEVGTPLWQRSNRKRHIQFKAGKMYVIDNMVHPDPRKGYVCIEQDYDQVIHFCWMERDAVGTKEDDLTPEPYDTIFKRVSKCTTGRVYVLKVNYLLNFPPPWMRFPRVACNIELPDKSEDSTYDNVESGCISPAKTSIAIQTFKQQIASVLETVITTPPQDVPEITAQDSARQALENNQSVKKLEELLLKMAGTDRGQMDNQPKSSEAEKTAFTAAAKDGGLARVLQDWSRRSLNVDDGKRSVADTENSDREYADAEDKTKATDYTAQHCQLTKSWKNLAGNIFDGALRHNVDSEVTKTSITEAPSVSAQNVNADQNDSGRQEGDVCVNMVLTDEHITSSEESFENVSNDPAEENEPSLTNVANSVVTETKTIKSSYQLTSKTIHIELSDGSGNSGSCAGRNDSGSCSEPVETTDLVLQETASLEIWESATEQHTHSVDSRQHTTQTGICKIVASQSTYKNIGLTYESSFETEPSEESCQDASHTAPVRNRGTANIHSKWESAVDPNSLGSESSNSVSVCPSENNLVFNKLAAAFETIPGTSIQTQTSFIESRMATNTEEVPHDPISTKNEEEEKDSIQTAQSSIITSCRSNSTGSTELDKTVIPASEDFQTRPQEQLDPQVVLTNVGEAGSSTVQNVSTDLARSSRSGASEQTNGAAKETSLDLQFDVESSTAASDEKEILTVGSESSTSIEGNHSDASERSNLPEQELEGTMAGTGNPTEDVEGPTIANPDTPLTLQSSMHASEMSSSKLEPSSNSGLSTIRSQNADLNLENEEPSPVEIGNEPPQITESAASEYSIETGKDTSLHLNVTSSHSGSNKNEIPIGTGESGNSTEKNRDMNSKTVLAASGTNYSGAPTCSIEPEKDGEPLNPLNVASSHLEGNTKDIMTRNSGRGNSTEDNRGMDIQTVSATTRSSHSLSFECSTNPEKETAPHEGLHLNGASSHGGSITKEILANGRDNSTEESIKNTPSNTKEILAGTDGRENLTEESIKTTLSNKKEILPGTGGTDNSTEENIKIIPSTALPSQSSASECSIDTGTETSLSGGLNLNVTSPHGGSNLKETPPPTGGRSNSTEANIKTLLESCHSGVSDSATEPEKNPSPFNGDLPTIPSSHMESNRKEGLEGTDAERQAMTKTPTETTSLIRHSSKHSSKMSYSQTKSVSESCSRTIHNQIDIITHETEEFLIEVKTGPYQLNSEDIWHPQNPFFSESLQTDPNSKSVLPRFGSTHKTSMKETPNSETGTSDNENERVSENVEGVSGVMDHVDAPLDNKSTNAIAMIALTQSGNENVNGEAKLRVESGVNESPQGISTSPLINISIEPTRNSSASAASQPMSMSIEAVLSTNEPNKKVRYNLRKRSQPRSETFLSGSAMKGEAKRSRVSSPGVPMPSPFKLPDVSPVRANRRYPQASGSTYLRTPGRNQRKRGNDNESDSDQEVPQTKRGRVSNEDSTWGENSRLGSLSRSAKIQPGGSTGRTSGTPVNPSLRTNSKYNFRSPSDPAKIEDGQQTEPVRIREIKKTGPETVVRRRTNRLSPVSQTPRVSRENRDKAQNTRPVVVEDRNDSKSKPRNQKLPEPEKKPRP